LVTLGKGAVNALGALEELPPDGMDDRMARKPEFRIAFLETLDQGQGVAACLPGQEVAEDQVETMHALSFLAETLLDCGQQRCFRLSARIGLRASPRRKERDAEK